jgi:hypothetical protein
VKRILFPVAGCVVAVLALTSKSFAHHEHMTRPKEYIAAAIIIGGFTLVGLLAGGRKPKPPVTPQRPGYTRF